MFLHPKSVAVTTAVLAFFTVSIIGWLGGLTPFVCCKRAVIGAVVAYIAAGLAVRAVSAIVTHAMITSWLDKQKDQAGDR